jgi:uncharacterized protein (DUF433 family)
MIDTKRTLQNLHERFPDLDLDDLFAILECIAEPFPTWNTNIRTIPDDPILGPKIY